MAEEKVTSVWEGPAALAAEALAAMGHEAVRGSARIGASRPVGAKVGVMEDSPDFLIVLAALNALATAAWAASAAVAQARPPQV